MAIAEKKRKASSSITTSKSINLSDYNAQIAELAYYKAEKRNFQPGYEMDDWLEAEQEFLFREKNSQILQKSASHLIF